MRVYKAVSLLGISPMRISVIKAGYPSDFGSGGLMNLCRRNDIRSMSASITEFSQKFWDELCRGSY